MPDGGRLTIRTSNVLLDGRVSAENMDEKAGPQLVIEIADTGSGINPDVLDRIFDPCFTTKATGHGTGLGLSTSLTIVKSHGGRRRCQMHRAVTARQFSSSMTKWQSCA